MMAVRCQLSGVSLAICRHSSALRLICALIPVIQWNTRIITVCKTNQTSGVGGKSVLRINQSVVGCISTSAAMHQLACFPEETVREQSRREERWVPDNYLGMWSVVTLVVVVTWFPVSLAALQHIITHYSVPAHTGWELGWLLMMCPAMTQDLLWIPTDPLCVNTCHSSDLGYCKTKVILWS